MVIMPFVRFRLPRFLTARGGLLGSVVFLFLLFLSVAVGASAGLLFVYNSDLPQVQSLEEYRPSLISEIYADDGQVIGSFALERRVVLAESEIPQLIQDAVIAVEDQHFFDHWGIDLYGVARAGIKNLMAGRVVEGGSTLTQQLSKNLFLTPERSFRRKIQEAMLAIQIERNYTKQQILTLYCNLIPLGHGMYGFAAASEFYFGKNIKDLNIEEAAMLAALPRAPSNYSPLLKPERALMRRNYVVDRLVAENKITLARGEEAKKQPVKLPQRQRPDELAPYFVEELRRYLERTYGTYAVHESGLKVYSTLNVEAQKAANVAVRRGLLEYDKRHGWRGAERNLLDDGISDLAKVQLPEWKLPVRTNDTVPGVVLESSAQRATVRIAGFRAQIGPKDAEWTGARDLSEILKPGDVALFRVNALNPEETTIQASLEQAPRIQGALLAIESQTGEVKAMVGGYDFDDSKFNRATQAQRQTGSVFKPFVYATAVDNGLLPDDTIVDAPINFSGYAPTNYDGKYEGTITIRRAIAQSRNVPAVKTLASLGIDKLIPYLRRFGITAKIDPYLPIALGSADITLMEMVSAYSVFPNEGVRAVPRMIRRVTTYDGEPLEENFPELKDVLPSETARTMVDLLQEPVRSGTATKAQDLKRPVAGKTGTTNDFTDAWFLGFTPSLTAGVWVGFDEKVTLGDKETGGRAALPIWIEFMQEIHKEKAVESFFEKSPPVPAVTENTQTPSGAEPEPPVERRPQ